MAHGRARRWRRRARPAGRRPSAWSSGSTATRAPPPGADDGANTARARAASQIVAVCVVTQINYLNKALDTFNTAVVSPIYYVFFTSFTIIASTIMFKDWVTQTAAQLTLEFTGFITILCGTALLHLTKDYDGGPNINMYTRCARLGTPTARPTARVRAPDPGGPDGNSARSLAKMTKPEL